MLVLSIRLLELVELLVHLRLYSGVLMLLALVGLLQLRVQALDLSVFFFNLPV